MSLNSLIPVIIFCSSLYLCYRYWKMPKVEHKFISNIIIEETIPDSIDKMSALIALNNIYKDPIKSDSKVFKDDCEKIYISYVLNGDNYKICLLGEPIKKYDINEVDVTNMIIGAYLSSDNSIRSVTDVLKEFQGPDYNFYENLDGPSFKLVDILKGYDPLKYNSIIVETLLNKTVNVISMDLDVRNLMK